MNKYFLRIFIRINFPYAPRHEVDHVRIYPDSKNKSSSSNLLIRCLIPSLPKRSDLPRTLITTCLSFSRSDRVVWRRSSATGINLGDSSDTDTGVVWLRRWETVILKSARFRGCNSNDNHHLVTAHIVEKDCSQDPSSPSYHLESQAIRS